MRAHHRIAETGNDVAHIPDLVYRLDGRVGLGDDDRNINGRLLVGLGLSRRRHDIRSSISRHGLDLERAGGGVDVDVIPAAALDREGDGASARRRIDDLGADHLVCIAVRDVHLGSLYLLRVLLGNRHDNRSRGKGGVVVVGVNGHVHDNRARVQARGERAVLGKLAA